MKLHSLLVILALAVLCGTMPSLAAPGTTKRETIIPNQYIVTLKPSANLAQFSRALQAEIARERSGGRTGSVVPEFGHQVAIGSSFKAVIGTLTQDLVDKLTANSQVALVEPDQYVYPLLTTQLRPPSWGLSRVSRRTGKDGNYYFPDWQGDEVDVYVFDTGVLIEHDEFKGRGFAPFRAQDEWSNADENGHGTHVAGTIAGTNYGVAKRAKIHAIKVLGNKDGSGSRSGTIRAMEWVANAIRQKGKTGVCNFSLGSQAGNDQSTTAYERAVASLFEAGCVVVKAAGNEQQDACNVLPARTPQGLTVAALAEDGQSLDLGYTNFGRCVQIAAPGTRITSAWNKLGYVHTISGTSMAAPHVAGVAALILGEEPWLKPQEVVDRVLSRATQNVIQGDLKGTPNRVAYVQH